jgi:ubiquitin C-terminal hydrolase
MLLPRIKKSPSIIISPCQSEIVELPEILIMTLKLFEFARGKMVKSAHRLPIDEVLQLCTRSISGVDSAEEFRLHGTIAHLGDAEQGHYIYVSRQPFGGGWTVYDDSHVTPIRSIAEIMGDERNCAAYVLVYARTGTGTHQH